MDSPELDQVFREIRRVIDTLPSWCPRLAWSLHPRDWELVRDQMKRQELMRSAEVLLDADRLYVLGVRIFPDRDAPRLQDIGAPRNIAVAAHG